MQPWMESPAQHHAIPENSSPGYSRGALFSRLARLFPQKRKPHALPVKQNAPANTNEGDDTAILPIAKRASAHRDTFQKFAFRYEARRRRRRFSMFAHCRRLWRKRGNVGSGTFKPDLSESSARCFGRLV